MITEKVTLQHSIIEMVQGKNMARYVHCQGTKLMYEVIVEDIKYIFPIDVSDKKDIGNTVFETEHKAITLMRWIRKGIEDDNIRWMKL